MAEDETVTGTGHTLLGTNALQGAVDKLDAAVNKLSSAADKMSTAATHVSTGGSSGGSGLWNATSNWLRGKANGGGATFSGVPAVGTGDPASSGGSHRAEGPTQTPAWAQAAGNFTQAMANGNGGQGVNGAYNVGSAVAGTRGGLIAAGAVAGVSGLSWAANNGASKQDMYNWNMLGGTATRMFNQGIGGVSGPSFSMAGVAGSQDASDFYGGMYALNSQSGYLQGSARATTMQAQAGAMGILNPTTNFSQNTQALIGLSSNTTTNLMRAFGINTYGQDPTQIARQLLDRLGAPKGKIDPKVIQLLLGPQSGLSVTLSNMVAAGALSQGQSDAIKTAAVNILVAQNHGMTADQFDTLTQQAAGNPKDSATQSAQAKLKPLGIGTTTAQTMMNKNANQTDNSVAELGAFSSALSSSTTLLNAFANMLNKWTGGALQSFAGASSGAGGGILGKIFGGAALLNSPPSLLGANTGPSGLNIFGKGDGLIASPTSGSTSSVGGGDVTLGAAGVGFSELGALVSSSPTGPGFVGVGVSGSGTGTSTTGGLAGSGDYTSGGTSSANPSAGTTGGGNGSPNYGTTPGVATGRVSPAQAIARIRAEMAAHVNIGVGMCQSNAHRVYGIGKGAPSALAAWNAAKYKHPMSDPPPVGAFVFWGGGYGHVAIYAGGGKVYSPGGPGDLSHWVLCPISAITSGWGKPLLGWTEDNNGVRVVKPATTQKHSPSTNHHHGGSSPHTGGSVVAGRGAGMIDGVLDPYTSGASVGASYGSPNKAGMVIPGVVGGTAGATVVTGRAARGGAQIIFQSGSIQFNLKGESGNNLTAATGRALGKAFAQELAQDSRIKALMEGTRV